MDNIVDILGMFWPFLILIGIFLFFYVQATEKNAIGAWSFSSFFEKR